MREILEEAKPMKNDGAPLEVQVLSRSKSVALFWRVLLLSKVLLQFEQKRDQLITFSLTKNIHNLLDPLKM